MAQAPSSQPTPAEIVEREAIQRRPATIGAALSATLTGIGIIVDQLISGSGVPSSKRAADFVETLTAQSAGRDFPNSFWTAYAKFKIDHGTETIIAAGLRGLALLLLVPITMFLMRAARDRGGSIARWMEPVAVAGLVAVGFATAAQGAIEISAFKSAGPAFVPHDVLDTLNQSDLLVVNGVRALLSLLIAIPVAMMAMQAMRVGLIPKVLGFMGVLVGILFVLPYDQTGILRAFWFGAVALTISGRMPGGLTPAWEQGIPFAPAPRQPPASRPQRGGKAKDAPTDPQAKQAATKGKNQADKAGGGKGPKLTK